MKYSLLNPALEAMKIEEIETDTRAAQLTNFSTRNISGLGFLIVFYISFIFSSKWPVKAGPQSCLSFVSINVFKISTAYTYPVSKIEDLNINQTLQRKKNFLYCWENHTRSFTKNPHTRWHQLRRYEIVVVRLVRKEFWSGLSSGHCAKEKELSNICRGWNIEGECVVAFK